MTGLVRCIADTGGYCVVNGLGLAGYFTELREILQLLPALVQSQVPDSEAPT
jgi:hypothetical protein